VQIADRITQLIGQQQWQAAFEVFDELLNGDFFPYPTYFRNITGLTDYFNELSVGSNYFVLFDVVVSRFSSLSSLLLVSPLLVSFLSLLFFSSPLSSRRIRPTLIRRGFSSGSVRCMRAAGPFTGTTTPLWSAI
jgi:hypothetical protein